MYCVSCFDRNSDEATANILEKRQSSESLEELIRKYREKNKIDASIFEGIKVRTVDGNEVLLSDIWKKRPVILKVLARLGCSLCKHEAKVLSDLQPFFERQGIGLAAVVFEDVDLKSFLSCGYWRWDIYIDPERNVYKAAGLTKVTRMYHMSCMVNKYFMKLLIGLNLNGIINNAKGDLRQLGGLFVINTDGQIVYDFRPKKFATYPSMKELYASVGGDPTEIDEELSDEYIYTQYKLAEDTVKSRASSLSSASTL